MFSQPTTLKKEKVINILEKEYSYRFWYLFLSFFFSSLCCFFYQKEMVYIYLYPLYNLSQSVIFTSISEAFTTTITICIWYGFLCTYPYGLYQSFCFFLPSFFPEEKSFFIKIYCYCLFSFLGTYSLCNFYIIPELLRWFLEYGVSTDFMSLSLQAKVSTYLSWSQSIYIYIFSGLQIPLILWLSFNFKNYKKREKYSKKTIHETVSSSHRSGPLVLVQKTPSQRPVESFFLCLPSAKAKLQSSGPGLSAKGPCLTDHNMAKDLKQKCKQIDEILKPKLYAQSIAQSLNQKFGLLDQNQGLKPALDRSSTQDPDKRSWSKALRPNRKLAIGGILLFSASISGPDPYSQGFIFFFFYCLFEYILWYNFLQKALETRSKSKKRNQ